MKEKERLVSMKTPDTTEVVEKFMQESARRSSNRTSLIATPDIDMKPRNDSLDVKHYRVT